MYTIKQVASEIDKLKPDFKDFITYLSSGNITMLQNDIANTINIFEKLFKMQLVMINDSTNNRVSLYILSETCAEFIYNHISDCAINQANLYKNKYMYIYRYHVKESFLQEHIATHVTNIKQYLTPYLWNRVRSKITQNLKTLNPDQFSLTIFKTYLSSLKKEIPSTQAIKYLAQIKDFDLDIKQQYIEVLVNSITQTSLAFQEKLNNIIPSICDTDNTQVKFMHLTRYYIRDLAYELGIPVPSSVLDTGDSSYKPFITGVNRKPTLDLNEFTALIGTIHVLKVSSKLTPDVIHDYFISELIKHLKQKDYAEIMKQYISTLELTKTSIEETINGLI